MRFSLDFLKKVLYNILANLNYIGDKAMKNKEKAVEITVSPKRLTRAEKKNAKLAKKAAELNEVPIGCVIEYEGKIIGRGYNRRITDKSTLAHAEITAIKKACKKMGDWRLEDCTLYVTLEPCQMCAGAIVQARIPKVVIGCMNPKAGCAGSILNILQVPQFNHQVETVYGVLQEECSTMLTEFFKALRRQLKVEKEK